MYTSFTDVLHGELAASEAGSFRSSHAPIATKLSDGRLSGYASALTGRRVCFLGARNCKPPKNRRRCTTSGASKPKCGASSGRFGQRGFGALEAVLLGTRPAFSTGDLAHLLHASSKSIAHHGDLFYLFAFAPFAVYARDKTGCPRCDPNVVLALPSLPWKLQAATLQHHEHVELTHEPFLDC